MKLVESVDYYFSGFDKIMETYGLDKIKTIGDAYMAAGGVVPDGANLILKTPWVIVSEFIESKGGTTITVSPNGCVVE